MIEKLSFLPTCSYHVKWRHTDPHPYKLQKFIFILCWEYWSACRKLAQNATKRPHVNCMIILKTHHYFRASIEARLNVMKTRFELSTRRTKINDFHLVFLAVREHDVFGFEVAVNYPNFFKMRQRIQQLESYLP